MGIEIGGTLLNSREIAYVARQAGFTGNDIVIAVAVALAESGGTPNATNNKGNTPPSTDRGLWQINDHHNADIIKTGDWKNPYDNARMAFAIFKRQGWNAWTVYRPPGAYRAGMLVASVGAKAPMAPKDYPRQEGAPGDTPMDNSFRIETPGGESLLKITDFFGFVTDSHNWVRLSLFLVGLIVIVIGVLRMTGDNQLGGVSKTVAALAITRKVGRK